MNLTRMKILIPSLLVMAAVPIALTHAFAQSTDGTVPSQITLDAPQNASFSFRGTSVSDFSITNNGASLTVNGAADSVGQLVDLGDISCADIQLVGRTDYDRSTQPLLWMEHSEAGVLLRAGNGKPSVPIQMGHCYLLYRVDSVGRIIAMFHVNTFTTGQSVMLDEVELFDSSTFTMPSPTPTPMPSPTPTPTPTPMPSPTPTPSPTPVPSPTPTPTPAPVA